MISPGSCRGAQTLCESSAARRPERPLGCGLSRKQRRKSLLRIASREIRRPGSLRSLSQRPASSQGLPEARLSSCYLSSFSPFPREHSAVHLTQRFRGEAYRSAIFACVSRDLMSSSVPIDSLTAPASASLQVANARSSGHFIKYGQAPHRATEARIVQQDRWNVITAQKRVACALACHCRSPQFL